MVANASHLLLVGYSLPTDDLINRCFIQSSASGRREPPFVTVVVKDTTDGGRRVATDGWVRSANVWDYLQLNSAKGEVNEAAQHTAKNIVEVFGPGRRATAGTDSASRCTAFRTCLTSSAAAPSNAEPAACSTPTTMV
jgi:hypothetical protein